MRKATVVALLGATLTCALLAWWVWAIGSIPPEVGVVTRPLPTEATREAWLLACGLARRGVPTGLIAPYGKCPASCDSTLADEPTADVLARFNRGNREFAATDDDGIVQIGRRDRPALIDGLLASSSQQPTRVMRPPLGLADGSELVDDVTYDPHDTASADDLRVGVVCSGGGGALVCSGRARECG